MPTIDRWHETWHGFGVSPTDELARLFQRLIACHSEPHRKYHTTRHLDECFSHFDEIRHAALHPAAVEIALWFHDAVYDPKRSDNEARSAEWARASAVANGVAATAADDVYSLVMSTRHAAVPVGRDAEIVVDVDLSILGAAPERFEEYERQIRAEYRWVPGFLFRRKRAKILQEFLARPRIFSTQTFIDRYEQQARANIARSLTRLRV